MSKGGDSWNFWKHFSLNLIRKEDFKPFSFEIAPRCFSNELLVCMSMGYPKWRDSSPSN